jgi:hypothetical protein
MAAYSMYLQLPSIAGGCCDKEHTQHVKIMHCSFEINKNCIKPISLSPKGGMCTQDSFTTLCGWPVSYTETVILELLLGHTVMQGIGFNICDSYNSGD